MKIPGFKRLQSQDFNKKYSDLTDNLFAVLNPFMEVMTQALNKRLNETDNFDCLDVTVDVKAPVTDFKIKNTQGGQMRAAQVLSCTNRTDPRDPLLAAPFVQFLSTDNDQLQITNITGLSIGKTYTIRIIFKR